ncbi:MAG TPA: hypothetical protein VJ742_13430 [Nitrososphaera sp.]|nr:hypothetical protein [Nitrososphaera sp.]
MSKHKQLDIHWSPIKEYPNKCPGCESPVIFAWEKLIWEEFPETKHYCSVCVFLDFPDIHKHADIALLVQKKLESLGRGNP